MNGTFAMDDLTSRLRQLAQDREEDQYRCESDQDLRRQDDKRLSTQIVEGMDVRKDAVR